MRIYLGADHAGYELKEKIKLWLKEKNHEVFDEGAFTFDKDDDYPDFVKIVAQQVAGDSGSMGIIFGGSGQGEAMAVNRFKGIRAVVYYGHSLEVVRLSREHNNSNILSLGARFLTAEEAEEVITIWLTTKFSGDDRHIRRLIKIDQLLIDNNNDDNYDDF
ncbi:MAG TPA: RpiB/LacA/LacB family sugar-phosphate isomerase [Candidatus Vogelbacteria bacterium]|nr:RpiB/LacA/LacB family sugar-phosphate isomerase [Candidatus Vogelbacteria bacterium]